MKKLKTMYVNLDTWLEKHGEKVVGILCVTAISALIVSLLNIFNGLG